MPRLRHLLVCLVAALLAAAVQNAAFSQLRSVEVPLYQPAATPAVKPGPSTVDESGNSAGLYDDGNPNYGNLQKIEEARVGLPLDKRGKVDWMTALRSGAIQPRSDLNGSKSSDLLNLDIILKNTKEMPYVKFPHSSHTEWLTCSNCHDKIFVPKAGANAITMTKIFQGEYCGACHGRVAFATLYSCERCHSVLHGDGKAWW